MPAETVSWESRLATLGVGMAALLSLAGAVAFAMGAFDRAEPAPQAVAPVLAPVEPSAQEAKLTPAQEEARRLQRELAAQQAALLEKQNALAAKEALEHAQASAAKPDPLAVDEELMAARKEREVRFARSRVSVVMYSTTWCPSCTRARAYMTEKGIPFTDHDVDKSESARLIKNRLNPKGSIPTIDIEGTVLVGFSGQAIERAIDQAAEKRTQRL